MAAGVVIGEGCYGEGGRVRAHVQAVGQKSHGTKEKAGDDLHNHDYGRYGYDRQGPTFTGGCPVLPESVIVDPPLEGVEVHLPYIPFAAGS